MFPKTFKLLLFLTFVIFIAGVPSSNAASSELSSALDKMASQVKMVTLKNGLRVIMYRRGQAPVFAGAVSVRVGGSDEEKGATGISHMFEHMAFKGTSQIGTKDILTERKLLAQLEELALATEGDLKKLTPEQQEQWKDLNLKLSQIWTSEEFTREYEKRGASGMNATTSAELTRYFVSLPRSEFEFWCLMESSRLLDPVMRQFYQERDVVMEERRMRTDDSAEGKLYEKLLDTAFKVHPYRFPVIGYPDDISRVTATAVDEFRKRYYVPGNIVITLVGDVDYDRDLKMVERYFGRLKPGPLPGRPTAVEPSQSEERKVVVPYPAAPVQFVAYHKPIYPHPDDAVFSVLEKLLAGSAISPLYEELVKKQQVASSVSAVEAPGNAYPNLLVFSLTPKAPHTNAQVLSAFDKVLSTFVADSLNEERLQEAKRALSAEYIGQLKSNESIGLDLASSELLYGDWRAVIDWFNQINAVDMKRVVEVFDKYVVSANRTVAAVETSRDK